MFFVIILIIVIVLGVYVVLVYNFLINELFKIFKDFKLVKLKSYVIEEIKLFLILLMGVDIGLEYWKFKWLGNSDFMILVIINFKINKIMMISLECDVLIKLSGFKNNG